MNINDTKSKISKCHKFGGGTKDDIKHFYSFKLHNGDTHFIEYTEQESIDGVAYELSLQRLHNKINNINE
jgi:hypothetical protein